MAKHVIITKEQLEPYINQALHTSEIAKIFNTTPTTIRAKLLKYGLKINFSRGKNYQYREIDPNLTHKFCAKCNQNLPISEFYIEKKRLLTHAYCKKCNSSLAANRFRENKRKALEYKGNKCVICGYNKCVGALHFHHIDPNLKEFSLSQLKKYTFDDRVKKELDKCVLVCANCHSEIHAGLVKIQE